VTALAGSHIQISEFLDSLLAGDDESGPIDSKREKDLECGSPQSYESLGTELVASDTSGNRLSSRR